MLRRNKAVRADDASSPPWHNFEGWENGACVESGIAPALGRSLVSRDCVKLMAKLVRCMCSERLLALRLSLRQEGSMTVAGGQRPAEARNTDTG